jgi:hypothetical protein
VTGARFRSAYEIYAHVLVAEARGLPGDKIATIVAGQRPSDLSREEAGGYPVATRKGGRAPHVLRGYWSALCAQAAAKNRKL